MASWRPRAVVLVFTGAAALLLLRLGALPLMEPDEARNAEVGREMMESGRWIVPTYIGLPRLDKPAFYFKLVALSLSAFGENEGAARLPSALSGLALLAATFLFGRRVYGQRTAVMAVAIVVTLPLFLGFARLVILDMSVTLFVCLAVFAGFLAEEQDGRTRSAWHMAGAGAVAMATLMKGPIGFILPWLVLGSFFAIDRRPRAILRMLAPANLVVLFGLVLPYFIALSLSCPDFPRYGILVESLGRVTSDVFHRGQPFYYYVPFLAAACFAWSVLLPESIAAAWRQRRRWSRADRLCVAWLCAVLTFFSLPQTKQPGYVLSMAIPLGLLLARLFAAAIDNPAGRAARAVRRGSAALAVLSAALAFAVLMVMARPLDAGRWLNANHEHVAVMLPHLAPLAAAGLLLAAAAACAAARRGSAWFSFSVFAAFLPIMALPGFTAVVEYAGIRSGRDIAQRVPTLPVGTELVCVNCFPVSLPFYLKRPVTLVPEDGAELPSNYIAFALANATVWPTNVVRRRDFAQWLSKCDHPLYLMGQGSSEAMIRQMAAANHASIDTFSKGYVGMFLDRPSADQEPIGSNELLEP